LSNTNEIATIPILQIFLEVNKALVALARIAMQYQERRAVYVHVGRVATVPSTN